MHIRRKFIGSCLLGIAGFVGSCAKRFDFPYPKNKGNGDDGACTEPCPPDAKRAPGGDLTGTNELNGLKVALDIGHSASGGDTGAFSNGETGISEYKLNIEEANQVARALRAKGATVSVFHYPQTASLTERGQNAAGHHIFLSLHHNAYSDRTVQGTEVLVHSTEHTANDQALASALQSKLVEQIWGSGAASNLNRGAKAQALGVLRNAPKSVTAACLSEPFFITESGMTAEKAKELSTKSAAALAQGIASFWLGQQPGALALVEPVDGKTQFPVFELWPEADDTLDLYSEH